MHAIRISKTIVLSRSCIIKSHQTLANATTNIFQANEENLRLLRESLATIKIDNISDISTALAKAFEILERFRVEQRGK